MFDLPASMSEGEPHFQGFSDREIKVIQQKQHGGRGGRYPAYGSMGPPQKTAHLGPRRAPPQKATHGSATRRQNSSGGPSTPPSGSTELPRDAYFVQSPPAQHQTELQEPMQSSKDSLKKDGNGQIPKTAASSAAGGENRVHVRSSDGGKEGGGASPEREEDGATVGERERELSDHPTSSALTNLELLQKQQKELEQENKRKKALVEQTLQERYKQSQMEAKTLHVVKEELDRLDSLLTRDVAILRDRIEEADRLYMAARKRYNAAEMEFVAAKLNLHRASETKELLSEHLCTIIQQNEARKAEKLADLLQALELGNSSKHPPPSSGSLPSPVLFQKTPTPGMNIWPHEKLGVGVTPPGHKGDSGSTSVSESAVHVPPSDTETGSSEDTSFSRVQISSSSDPPGTAGGEKVSVNEAGSAVTGTKGEAVQSSPQGAEEFAPSGGQEAKPLDPQVPQQLDHVTSRDTTDP